MSASWDWPIRLIMIDIDCLDCQTNAIDVSDSRYHADHHEQ